MKRTHAATRGETLIEAMVALVVFTIGMLGVLSASVLAHKQNGLAVHETRAANIARDLIDDLQRLPYTHPAFTSAITHHLSDPENTGDGTHRPLLGAAPEILAVDANGATGTGGVYDVSWVATPDVDGTGVEQGKTIEIDVTLTTGGFQQKLVFYSYKYNPAALAGQPGTFEEI